MHFDALLFVIYLKLLLEKYADISALDSAKKIRVRKTWSFSDKNFTILPRTCCRKTPHRRWNSEHKCYKTVRSSFLKYTILFWSWFFGISMYLNVWQHILISNRRLFEETDLDGDNCISPAEIKELLLGIRFRKPHLINKEDAVLDVLGQFDIDGDGTITKDEFIAGISKWLDETKKGLHDRSYSNNSLKDLQQVCLQVCNINVDFEVLVHLTVFLFGIFLMIRFSLLSVLKRMAHQVFTLKTL